MESSYVTTSTTDPATTEFLAGMGVGSIIFYIAVIVFMLIVMWKIYAKAGQPGWAAIIPIYNLVVMFRIIKMEWWHILIMLFVPFAQIVYAILIPLKLAKVFGKSTGFGVLSIFFSIICYPILAFGSAKYEG